MIRDFEPVAWWRDDLKTLARKNRIRFYSLPIIQAALLGILQIFGRLRIVPRLVRFVYWRLLIGNWYLGYRAGAGAN